MNSNGFWTESGVILSSLFEDLGHLHPFIIRAILDCRLGLALARAPPFLLVTLAESTRKGERADSEAPSEPLGPAHNSQRTFAAPHDP